MATMRNVEVISNKFNVPRQNVVLIK